MNDSILLLKRVKIRKKKSSILVDSWDCLICIDEHGKCSRFRDDKHLLNHIRANHYGHYLEKPLKKLIKFTKIGIELGVISQ